MATAVAETPPSALCRITVILMNQTERLRATDWSDLPEPTICSQLIMPVLVLLGYGEHTLHKVKEQQSYTLHDPTVSKGSRRVKLDYQPRVYEEGLWVMEAKGSNARVSGKTLGQVRDYAIHPEIRAALMVTVDAAGFRVFDPWDLHWDEPMLAVGLNEVVDRLDDLRAVLGADRVADIVRRRHLDHLRRALSASLEFGVLVETEQEFAELIRETRADIDGRRRALHRKAMQDAEELHERVLRQSGVWGVAQNHNSPWIGSVRASRDFSHAVLYQDERQRPTQILQFRPAVAAVYRDRCPEGAELFRPLWWLHVVVLGGCLELCGQPGCEPYATDVARQAIRDVLLGFPDDPAAAAAWKLQRDLIPVVARIAALGPLEEFSRKTRETLSAENRIRYRFDPSWFFMHSVRSSAIDVLAKINPWTPEEINKQAAEVVAALERLPIPDREWAGPAGDPWLDSWKRLDPLLMCGLSVLSEHPAGDELLAEAELRHVIVYAAASEDALLRRAAVPLAERLAAAA